MIRSRIIDIRTANFEQMCEFYQKKLKMRGVNVVGDNSVWFNDFEIEVHIDRVNSQPDINQTQCLCFQITNVSDIAEGLRGRGISVQVRNSGSTSETFIIDPDGNTILLVAKSKQEATV